MEGPPLISRIARERQNERSRESLSLLLKKARAFEVRPTGVADIPALVAMRRAMFVSMGHTEEAVLAALVEASTAYFHQALPAGEFCGWVAEAGGQIVGCGGLVVHRIPPTTYNLDGRVGYIMNMYTLPGWRRRGVARAIMAAMLSWLQAQGISVAALHATPQGRPLYEQLGFAPTNEMRALLTECKSRG